MLNCYPPTEKFVPADGDSLGPFGEVHVKFKLGKVEFNNVFIILNNLQWEHYSQFTMAM